MLLLALALYANASKSIDPQRTSHPGAGIDLQRGAKLY